MNLTILTGRMTRDPELKYAQGGKSYCRFSIAVDRPFKKDDVDFINCVAFGKTAELICEYMRKGSKLGIQGRLQMNRYEVDGKKITTYEVIVDQIEFLDSKKTQEAPQKQQEPETTEDYPF
jgi:single-strand DNA-binding protein